MGLEMLSNGTKNKWEAWSTPALAAAIIKHINGPWLHPPCCKPYDWQLKHHVTALRQDADDCQMKDVQETHDMEIALSPAAISHAYA